MRVLLPVPEGKRILDVCCGGKMFYFDKNNPDVLFMDIRSFESKDHDGRTFSVKPDVVADFRKIPFEDNSFYMVVFDPPHFVNRGTSGYMYNYYGGLDDMWPYDINMGFVECMRVLRPGGTLIFKWNETDISLSELLKVIPFKPIFGQKQGRALKTHWLVFMK